MIRRLGGIAAAFLLVAACRKTARPGAAAARALPRGYAIWLTDPAAGGAPDLGAQLQRLGTSALFLPGGELVFEGGRWALRPPPARAAQRTPIVLVIRANPASPNPLEPGGGDATAVAHAIAAGLGGGPGPAPQDGSFAGIHLDFSAPPGSVRRYADIVGALRKEIGTRAFVSVTLRSAPASDEERKRFEPLRGAVDGFVAFVFGPGAIADPAAVDELRVPWWAAYEVSGAGAVIAADGSPGASVGEIYLDRLSGHARIEFENDLSVNDASLSAFTLVARGPVRVEGLSLDTGDRIAFRLPSAAEMLFRLGSTLAGKRFALGRVIVMAGATEADRLFSLGAFEDVLLGRSLAPALDAGVQVLGRNALVVDAVNRSHQASIASRMANWVEVDLAPAHPADLQIGGFDRYETYDAAGRPVTPGRASRVRLFETLVAPLETIHPARIVVRGNLPAPCCPLRTHVIAAAGPEVAGDWSTPPAPTPTKAPVRPRKK